MNNVLSLCGKRAVFNVHDMWVYVLPWYVNFSINDMYVSIYCIKCVNWCNYAYANMNTQKVRADPEDSDKEMFICQKLLYIVFHCQNSFLFAPFLMS